EVHIAVLDVQKAFDSVTFEAVFESAHRLGLDEATLCYLRQFYLGQNTRLSFKGEEIQCVPTHGVRQGDPLSSVLFNGVIDGLLCSLDTNIGFRVDQSTRINAMAFADDLILIALTRQGL